MKKILFVASEVVPFIKTGGLADVVGSLPKYFDKKYYDVRVILPKYLCMKEKWVNELQYVTHFYMDLAWRRQYVGILQTEYEGITFYFVDNEYYMSGDTPYGTAREDIEKFAFFSKAVLSALPDIGFKPDIIHCHDWQTGLIPVFVHDWKDNPFYKDIKTIMTIHNLKFQGVWDVRTVIDITGLSETYFTPDKLEAYGDANYLKGGIVYSQAVTTVSETYAEEIKTPFYGEHLHGLMSARANDLRGIVNGIDYEVFNPETDPIIAATYNTRNFQKEKFKNKLTLQEELGLEVDENKFMIGIVSRLTDQKGFDLIAYMMEELCQNKGIQLVVLGSGEEKYQNMFRHYMWKYPKQVSAKIEYSEEIAHKIYAASDAFLMPSQFEPCGLSQLISLRYGTLPIVRETGGLKDTVIPYNEYEESGTGFSFANYNAHEMKNTIEYAFQTYTNNRHAWNAMMKRAMEQDYSWDASARKYQEMYDWLID